MKFSYEAYNRFGQTQRDTVEADSIELAGEVLRAAGLNVMKIVPASEPMTTVLPDPKPIQPGGIMPPASDDDDDEEDEEDDDDDDGDDDEEILDPWQEDLNKSIDVIEDIQNHLDDEGVGDSDAAMEALLPIALQRAFSIARGR